eukprot:m51a1_g11848 hypothetical protein (423) ;mRNA; f:481838-483835
MENVQQRAAYGAHRTAAGTALADISNTQFARPSLKPHHVHAAPYQTKGQTAAQREDAEVNGWTATDYSSKLALWSSLSAVQQGYSVQPAQQQQLRHSVVEYCNYAQAEEELDEDLYVDSTQQADEAPEDEFDEPDDSERRIELSRRAPQTGLFACPDNAAEVFINLSEQEGVTACSRGFMEKIQGRISSEARVTATMRAILINWLDNVCLKCKLHEETLFHTVNYIDRYLSKRTITRNDLQLLGIAALLVAAKVAEVDDLVPRVWELRDLCDGAYTAQQIVVAERALLDVLDYHILVPHSRAMVELLHCVLKSRTPVVMLSYYLCELGLTSYETSQYAPSMVASAALYLTHVSLHMPSPWPREVKYITNYADIDLWQCVLSLHAVWSRASTDPNIASVYEKFSATEYHEASSQSLFPVPILA